MRLIPLVLIASLAFAPGCSSLAIMAAAPPAIGAGGGALIGAEKSHHTQASIARHAVIGALLGAVVDVVATIWLTHVLNEQWRQNSNSCPTCD
jgi:hypothetical protein